jgi:hypothetical protein
VCFDFLYNIYLKLLSIQEEFSQILQSLEVSRWILIKASPVQNSTELSPVRAELLHADKQTDMMKLMVNLCNFANVPNNVPNVTIPL